MDEIVERVARAIAGLNRLDDPMQECVRQEYYAQARAAIAAMREPISEMLIAGQKAEAEAIMESHVEGVSVPLLHKLAGIEPAHMKASYQAMIDTAIKP